MPPPPERKPADLRLASPGSSSPVVRPSQEEDKENAPVGDDKPAAAATSTDADADTEPGKAAASAGGDAADAAPTQQSTTAPAVEELEPGTLPTQIANMLSEIKAHIEAFTTYPPHTIQRLAELIISPRAHYKALASYLHAVDRVVQVTSGTSTYPLPPAVPDMSHMAINGADGVAWSNPTTTAAAATLGSDEALGGALLTPIPWLTRRSPESASNGSDNSHSGSGSGAGAQIHSEGTETIDGPNGMGSVETVSVSVNGVPSTGHARGVTQGELLRQEQRAGVVPVSQLSRHGHGGGGEGARGAGEEDEEAEQDGAATEDGGAAAAAGPAAAEEEEETPHARGPEEIGVNDTGPQAATTSWMSDGGVEMQGIDIAAAVGRNRDEEEHPTQEKLGGDADSAAAEDGKVDEDEKMKDDDDAATGKSPGAESTGTKREAEDDIESEPAKKPREAIKDADDGEKSTAVAAAVDDVDKKKQEE